MKHICETIYKIGAKNKIYGTDKGICRITGEKSSGIVFDKWVRDTFNDHDKLVPGTIISNEALFCFDESSEIIQQKTGKEKTQRFRTYSHIVKNGEWFCFTKANKREIYDMIIAGAEMVCLSESGQKHILFKHKEGMWQLEENHIEININLYKDLHFNMCELLAYQFSQNEIITGNYLSGRILKSGMDNWLKLEKTLKHYRGTKIFEFVSFALFTDKNYNDPEKITEKLETKPNRMVGGQLEIF